MTTATRPHPPGSTPADSGQNPRKTKRQTSRAARERQHPGREPVIVTCRKCGHVWDTYAADRSAIRCPSCRYAFKFRRPATGTPVREIASTQAAPVAAPPRQHVRSALAEPKPGRARVAAELEATEDDDDDEEYAPAATEPIRPGLPPYLPPPAVTRQDQVYDAINQAVYFGRPQQITSTDDVIEECAVIIREAQREAEPLARYQTTRNADGSRTLKVYRAQAVIVPAVADALSKVAGAIRGNRTQRRGNVCQFCGAVTGVSTMALYRVTSPALGGTLILCRKHATAESSIPGTEVIPA